MSALHITSKKIILFDRFTIDAWLTSAGKVFNFLINLCSSSPMRVTIDILASNINVFVNLKSPDHPRMLEGIIPTIFIAGQFSLSMWYDCQIFHLR